jgi:two-component system sensor histidine kinase KdpD
VQYLNAIRTDVPSSYGASATAAANAEHPAGTGRACLLVMLGSSEYDLDLIHSSQRLAAGLEMDWTVVCVQPSTFRFLPDQDRDRRLEVMRIAESLGGDSVVLHGASAARAIAAYARLRQASKILVGSPAHFGWHALQHYSRITALKRLAPGLEIIAIAPRNRLASRVQQPAESYPGSHALPRPNWTRYLWGVGTTLISTAVALPIATHLDLINIVMIYMLGAAAAGLWLGRGPSALAAVANIVAFDYFFVPPRFSFLVVETGYLVTFAVMLLVALIIANLMIAVREQTEAAGAREHHTAVLYSISRELAVTRDAPSMARIAVRRIGEELHCSALILLCADDGQLNPVPIATFGASAPTVDLTAAQWVAAHRQRAGLGTPDFPAASALYFPLSGAHDAIGVLAVERAEPGANLLPEQQQLLEALAGQLASALERAKLTEIAHAAHVAAERAAMRNTLLASISHDLRTPLSAIAGAGSIVAQSDFALDIYRRVTLGRLIEDKARDMSELLSNVLELVRLESGADVLNRDWHSVADMVGLAISRHEMRLSGWQIVTALPEELPLLSVDATLFVQMIGNLLENAVKYTPPETIIRISAGILDGTKVQLVVEDNGPGWPTDQPERLFDKFSRGRIESNAGGVGIGLTICKAVVRLHQGEIRAAASREGGARIEIELPLPSEEPRLVAPAADA